MNDPNKEIIVEFYGSSFISKTNIMENKEIVKQMIDLHKKSFDNFFLATALIQDQAEKLLITFVHQMPGMNNGGGEVVNQWISAYKKNRDDFKKAVDDGYAKVESFFD